MFATDQTGDIDKLMNWSDTWLLKFNKSKCKHMHLGPETDYNYMMEENMIANTMEEKDRCCISLISRGALL
jgi:hypothetical protein